MKSALEAFVFIGGSQANKRGDATFDREVEGRLPFSFWSGLQPPESGATPPTKNILRRYCRCQLH
jgi:hypothetical protein